MWPSESSVYSCILLYIFNKYITVPTFLEFRKIDFKCIHYSYHIPVDLSKLFKNRLIKSYIDDWKMKAVWSISQIKPIFVLYKKTSIFIVKLNYISFIISYFNEFYIIHNFKLKVKTVSLNGRYASICKYKYEICQLQKLSYVTWWVMRYWNLKTTFICIYQPLKGKK